MRDFAIVLACLFALAAAQDIADTTEVEEGYGNQKINISQPVEIPFQSQSESLLVGDSEVLPNGNKLYKIERVFRSNSSQIPIPLFQSSLVVKEDKNESLKFSISSDNELYTPDTAAQIEQLLKSPLPNRNDSIRFCQIRAKIDKASSAKYSATIFRYIHLVAGTDDYPTYAIILDDVRLNNNMEAVKTYRCLVDATNQTVLKGFQNIQIETPPVSTTFEGLGFSSGDLPVDKSSGLCRMATKDNVLQEFDQKYSKNARPVENQPMKFDCQQLEYGDTYLTSAQCLDYANRTKRCLQDKLNITLKDVVENGTVKLFIHYDRTSQYGTFFNGLGIYFSDGVPASASLCKSVDMVSFHMGYAISAKVTQLVDVDGSQCVNDMFSGMTALAVSRCLVETADAQATLSENTLVSDSNQDIDSAANKNPAISSNSRVPQASSDNNLNCNAGIPLAILNELGKSRSIYESYRLFYNASKFFWNRISPIDQAACGVLQYARDGGQNATQIGTISAAFDAANIKPQSECSAAANLKQKVDSAKITTKGRGRSPTTSDVPIYQLRNCVKLYGLSGSKGDLSIYKLTIPSNLRRKPTKLVVTLRNSNDENSNADISLKYDGVPTSRDDKDVGDHMDSGSATITVRNPPDGDYYVTLFGYSDYTDNTLSACYVSEVKQGLGSVSSQNPAPAPSRQYAPAPAPVYYVQPAAPQFFSPIQPFFVNNIFDAIFG